MDDTAQQRKKLINVKGVLPGVGCRISTMIKLQTLT